MEERYFDTGSIRLNYVEGPPTGRPLLLLHSLAANLVSFYELIPGLSEGWQVFALDLRGHGKSDRAVSYRLRDHLSDITSFIEKRIGQPTVVFGHSLGGMIGIMLAAERPDLVRALIVGDSLISKEFHAEVAKGAKEQQLFWRNLALTGSPEVITSELKKQLVPVPGREESIPAGQVFGEPYFNFMAYTLGHLDPEVLTADVEGFADTYLEYRPDQQLPGIQCPVLLLQANPDLGGLMRDEDVKRAIGVLARPSHEKVPNVGHALHMIDKEAVLEAVNKFLESLD